MSEHAPRAYVNCAAYGCKQCGTMTRSTIGGSNWLCAIHFAADQEDWQAITAEINRLSWLVDAIKVLRDNDLNPDSSWRTEVNKSMSLAQRNDLRDNGETVRAWLARLDKVLTDSCAAVVQAKPEQATIPEVG